MNKYLLVSVLSALAFPAYADVEGFVNAAKDNNIAQIQQFLQAGENINAKNSLGNTALHYATATGNSDMVKFLLDKGADATIANNKGWTPLAIAEKKGLGEIVSMFQSQQNNKDLSALVEKASADAQKASEKVAEIKDNAAQKVENLKEKTEAKTAEVKENIQEKADAAKEAVAQIKQETVQAATEVKNDIKEKADAAKDAVQVKEEVIIEAVKETQANTDNTVKEVKETVAVVVKDVKPEVKAEAKTEAKASEIKAEAKTETKPAPKAQPRPFKPVVAKPAPKPVPSGLDKEIFAGDEEIVYCLYYLGLQTDQHYLTLASEFFAGSTAINKARFDKIAEMALKYYDNASEAETQKMASACSKIITPQNTDKQNQIIRSVNKAIGY